MKGLLKEKLKKWAKKYILRTLGGVAITALLAGNTLGYYELSLLETLDNLVYDTRIRLDATQKSDTGIVILDIDEPSLASPKLGRWPWSRDRMSEILDVLFDHYKVRLLAFDVVFAEPDNSSGLQSLRSLSNSILKESADFQAALKSISPELDFDGRFAKALKGRPVILGYYFNASRDASESGELPFPVLTEDDFQATYADMPKWSGYGANLREFVDTATLSGHFNPIVDRDGIVRRLPLLIQYKDDYYESLALAIARLHLALKNGYSDGLRLPAVIPAPQVTTENKQKSRLPTLQKLLVGDVTVPVDSSANVLIPYRGGPKTFSYISIIDILEKRTDPAVLKDKIVIVGTTAPGLVDLRATPVSGIYPGVEVHANLVSALIDQRTSNSLKSYFSEGQFFELLSLLAVGLIFSIFLPLASPTTATVLTVSALLLTGVGSQLLWSTGLVFSVGALCLLILTIYLLNTAYGFLIESRQRRQFTSLFGQYVPPELVKKMAEDPEKYSMEGRKAHLTVLFSDVAGFTSIAEKLSPQDLTEFISEYLTTMSQIIRDHGGTLDKYIGDAIMAFWGAPLDDPCHAVQACRAALLMQDRITELNWKFSKKGWPTLQIGIGLSTGEMTVGDMGSRVRKAYTVMGDAVNLGSRLEGLTRVYQNKIIVSNATFCEASDILFREIDHVRVKGKNETVTIYEPIAPKDKITDHASASIERWSKALAAYRARHWSEARSLLTALHADCPDDGLYKIFLRRVDDFEQDDPGQGWTAITSFESK